MIVMKVMDDNDKNDEDGMINDNSDDNDYDLIPVRMLLRSNVSSSTICSILSGS